MCQAPSVHGMASPNTHTTRATTPGTGAPAPATGRVPLWLLALALAAFATGTDDMVIAGLLPELSADLGVGVPAAGQLVTVYALVYGLGAPVLAVLTAHAARRRLLVRSAVLFTLANLLMAVAPGYGTLLVLRVVAAALAAVIVPAALAVVADLAPEGRRGRWLSGVTAGITLSLIVGVPLGTWVAELVHWRATMVLVAGVAGLAALGMMHLPGKGETVEARDVPARLAPLTSLPVLTVSLAMVVAGSGGMMGYIYLAPLVEHLTGDLGALPLLILVFGVAGFGGVLLGGRGTDRVGPAMTLAIGFGTAVMMTAVLAALARSAPGSIPSPVLACVIAVWAVGLWSFSPPIQAWLLPRAVGSEGAVLALSTSGMYLGFAGAGAVGGVVITESGVAAVPLAASILLALGGLLLAASMGWTTRREGSRYADR